MSINSIKPDSSGNHMGSLRNKTIEKEVIQRMMTLPDGDVYDLDLQIVRPQDQMHADNLASETHCSNNCGSAGCPSNAATCLGTCVSCGVTCMGSCANCR